MPGGGTVRLRNGRAVTPYSAQSLSYRKEDYPGLKLHWKCSETSGVGITDEVRGTSIRPSVAISFGSPAYSVTLTGASDDPVIGTYPTFDTTKFILVLSVARCTDAATGRNTLGQIAPGPGIALSFAGGMHVVVQDDSSFAISTTIDATKTLTLGTDYVLTTIVRPSGQNIEGAAYTTDGVLVHQQLVANTGMTAITPVLKGRPAGLAFYQFMAYQFSSEPTDLKSAIIWHAAKAMAGVKAPYPGWRNRG